MFLTCFPRWEKLPGCFPCCLYIIPAARAVLLWFVTPLHHDNMIASRNVFWYVQHAFTCTSNTSNCKSTAGEVQAIKATANLVCYREGDVCDFENLYHHCFAGPISSLKSCTHWIAKECMAVFLKNFWKFRLQFTRAAFRKYGPHWSQWQKSWHQNFIHDIDSAATFKYNSFQVISTGSQCQVCLLF